MVFQPATQALAGDIRSEIQYCIGNTYERVAISSIDISFNGNEVDIEIFYSIVNTNTLNKVMLQFIKSDNYIV